MFFNVRVIQLGSLLRLLPTNGASANTTAECCYIRVMVNSRYSTAVESFIITIGFIGLSRSTVRLGSRTLITGTVSSRAIVLIGSLTNLVKNTAIIRELINIALIDSNITVSRVVYSKVIQLL